MLSLLAAGVLSGGVIGAGGSVVEGSGSRAVGGEVAGGRGRIEVESRFEWAAPLALGPVRIHESLARVGLGQSTARRMGLQGRVLWIDATANLGRVNSDEKIAALMEKVAEVGFNTVVFDVKPINGYTMYPSRLTEQITSWRESRMEAGYDPLRAMVREGQARGLSVFVALNAFSEGHLFGKRDFGKPDNQFFKPGWGYDQPDLQTVRYIPEPVWEGFSGVYSVARGMDPGVGFEEDMAVFSDLGRAPEGLVYATVDRNGFVGSVGREKPSELGGRALWVARSAGAQADLLRSGPGARLRLTSRATYVRIGEAQNQIPLMMNPHREENQRRALDFIAEIAGGYEIDGLLYDDRLRFGGLDSDFSEHTRGIFERRLGRAVRWPDEVYTTVYSPSLTPSIVPGPLYDAWMTFRAEEMARFIARARAELKRHRPQADFGVYAGSWYGDYQRYGSNYASTELDAGFPFLTRGYRRTGFAGDLDVLITGCYYPFGTVVEALAGGGVPGRTVEAGGILSNRVARDMSWVYAGIMIADYFPDPARIESALQAAAATTQGVMVFDLSHRIEEFWPVFERAFRRPARAPHQVPGLIDQVRSGRREMDARGLVLPPFPFFEGAPGTGF